MTLLGASVRANAVVLQYQDPVLGAAYLLRSEVNAQNGETPGPVMEKLVGPNEVVGYEIERLDDRITLGGWAASYFGGVVTISHDVLARIVVVAEPGEQNGDVVTLYAHSKVIVDSDFPFGARGITTLRLVGTAVVLASEDFMAPADRGRFATTVPVQVAIGSVLDMRVVGSAGREGFADTRYQLSTSPIPPPDPPLAAPLVPSLGIFSYALLASLLISVPFVMLGARTRTFQSRLR